jgi:hypothetical protein
MSFIRFPAHVAPAPGAPAGRPLAELVRQPVFAVSAVIAAALGYGVMNLLMAATPIAMQQCRHPFDSAALVLEWHVLGMFVPSFFTGQPDQALWCRAGDVCRRAAQCLCVWQWRCRAWT